MKKIGFIGYGSLGHQIKNMFANELCEPIDICYFDNFSKEEVYPFNMHMLCNFIDHEFIVCLGYKHLQLKHNIILGLIGNRKLKTLIHPSSYIDKSVQVGKGVVIYPMCNVDQMCELGNGVLLNNSATISHNTKIGDCCYISPGVTINGNVTIGSCCFIGAGVSIANGVTIGKNSVIGIGSVITEDIKENTVGIGNPFQRKEIKLN